MTTPDDDLETLRGVPAIAAAMGPSWNPRKIRYAIEKKALTGVFFLNGAYCIRKKRLLEALEQLEKQGQK